MCCVNLVIIRCFHSVITDISSHSWNMLFYCSVRSSIFNTVIADWYCSAEKVLKSVVGNALMYLREH